MESLKKLGLVVGLSVTSVVAGLASPYSDPDFSFSMIAAASAAPDPVDGAEVAPADTLDRAPPASMTEQRLDGVAGHLERLTRELRHYRDGGDSARALTRARDLSPHLAALRNLDLVLRQSAVEERGEMETMRMPSDMRDRFETDQARMLVAGAKFRAAAERVERTVAANDGAGADAALRGLSALLAEGDVTRRMAFDPATLAAQQVKRERRQPATTRAQLSEFLSADTDIAARAGTIAAPASGMRTMRKSGAVSAAAIPELENSEEATVTPHIQALADQLGHNPVKIFNWVRNNIDFVPTHGAIQGAELTLINRRGNAADTNSLLVALLRASGIPARFVYGTVDVPLAQAVNWLKAGSAQGAVDTVQTGGIPSTLLRLNGQAYALRLQHLWVEAYIDFTPSRGAKNRVPDAWIPMDASFKQYTRTPAVDVLGMGGWNPTAAAEALVQDARIGADGSVTKLNTYAYQTQVDAAIARISQSPDYAEFRQPEQWLGRASILASELPVISGTLPFATNAASARFAALPASLKYYLDVELYATQQDVAYESPAMTAHVATVRLGGRSLFVNYKPATATDQLGLESYAASNAASLPLSSFRVIPQLKLGEEVLFEGWTVGMGVQQFWKAGVRDPQGRIDGFYEAYQFAAGSHISFTPDLGGIGEGLLQEYFGALPDSSRRPIGEALHLAGLQYWYLNDSRAELYARGWGGVFLRMPSVGVFAAPLQVRYFFGIPRTGYYAGFATDIKADRMALYHPNPATQVKMAVQAGSNGSLAESTTWDLLLNNRAGNSLSASSIIAWANSNGVPIHTVTAANVDQILPRLQTTADVKDEIRNAALSGLTIIVPEREFSRARIQAAGYVMLDPDTGAAVYRVDGGLNGAINVGCIAKAVLLNALCESKFAKLMAKRLADLAARFALRIGLGAVMAAVAPPLAIVLPVVSAVLLAVTIIQVTYEVLTWVREVMNGTISLTPEEMAEAGIRAINEYACNYLPPCFNNGLGALGNAGLGAGLGLGGGAPNGPSVGNPVSPANGVKTETEVDYQGSGPFPLRFVRTYLSYLPNGSPVGHKWNSNYHQRLRFPDGTTAMAPPEAVLVQRRDGGWQQYVYRSGTYSGSADVPERLERLTDGLGRTTQWRLRNNDDETESYDADGRLQSIESRTGLRHTLSYAADGLLERVTDSFGRSLAFEHDAMTHQVTAVIDPELRRISYTYDAGALVRVDYPDTTSRRYHYETPGWPTLLTGITDGRGQRYASWKYDEQGRVIESTHADGAERVALQYEDNRTTVTDARNVSRTYLFARIFDSQRMTEMSEPCAGCGGNSSARIAYDGAGYPSLITDHNGNQTQVRVNARGLPEQWTRALGKPEAQTVSVQWHATWNLPAQVTEIGATGTTKITTYEYDSRGNPSRRTVSVDGQTRVWTYVYNAAGQIEREDGPRTDVQDVTLYAYDAQGNLSTRTDANNLVTRYTEYDAHGKLLTKVDPNGTTTRYGYDRRDRLVSTTVTPAGGSGGETSRYVYDGAGLLSRMQMPDGSGLNYVYDGAGRLTGVRDDLGNRIAYTLDAASDQVREDSYDPAGNLAQTLSRSFDILGRVQEFKGARAGDVTAFGYDDNGNETSMRAPLHTQAGTRQYDALNRLRASVDPLNGQIGYRYDAQDNLREVADPRGLRTAYGYNGFNELVSLASPDTGNTGYVYDAAGNLVRRTDARNIAANYSYDAANRLTAVAYPDESIGYVYDELAGGVGAKGRLTTLSDGSGSTRYVYDAQGRVIAKTQQLGAETNTAGRKVVGMAYTDGLMTGMSLPSGAVVGYRYGSDGRVLEIRVNGQLLISEVDHFLFDALRGWTTPAGRYRRDYDQDGRIAAYTGAASNTSLQYDLAGRVSAQGGWNYGYDDLDRLTQASGARNLTWQYDAAGNRTQQTDGAAASSYGIAADSNRLASIDGVARQYDAAGNTVTADGRTYIYSGRNRMTEVRQGAATLARYAYNGLGERVCAASGTGACPTAAAAGSAYRQYVYDDAGHLLGEYDASGALIAEHLWIGDTPVAVLKPVTTAATHGGTVAGGVAVYYVYPDHLDTPRVVVNAANAPVWRWDSAPFGDTAADENPSGFGAYAYGLRFPGQQYDPVTGLHYNYFRDYEAATGRYAQSDPLGLIASLETYAYVEADPIGFSDRFGLMQDMRDRWCDLMNDPRLPASVRGWLINQCKRPKKDFKAPPGLDLGHRYGCPADCGFGYEYADPKWTADHQGIEHRYYRKRGGIWNVRKPKPCKKPRKLDLPPKGALP